MEKVSACKTFRLMLTWSLLDKVLGVIYNGQRQRWCFQTCSRGCSCPFRWLIFSSRWRSLCFWNSPECKVVNSLWTKDFMFSISVACSLLGFSAKTRHKGTITSFPPRRVKSREPNLSPQGWPPGTPYSKAGIWYWLSFLSQVFLLLPLWKNNKPYSRIKYHKGKK